MISFLSGARLRGARAALPALPLLLVLPAQAARERVIDASPIADSVVSSIQKERAERGLPPLERRPVLDEIAQSRAEELAARPRRERLRRDRTIARTLREDGRVGFRQARDLVHLQKNHPRPEDGVLEGWRVRATPWRAAVSDRFDGIGVAAVRGPDLWLVFVAILVEDLPPPEELRRDERTLLRMINDVRAANGLARLAHVPSLESIARAHSADMAERGYFAHETPEGLEPGDRVRARGETFARVSENIFSTDVEDDTLSVAVESWMNSPGHRANILDPEVTESGLGIAVSNDGLLCFTQLFRRPLPETGEAE